MTRPDASTTLALIGTLALSLGAGLFHPGLGLVVFGALILLAAVLVAQAEDSVTSDEGTTRPS